METLTETKTHDFQYSMPATNGNYWFACRGIGKNKTYLEADFTKEKPQVGDRVSGIPFDAFTFKIGVGELRHTHITKIISVSNSRGQYNNPNDAMGAFHKMELESIDYSANDPCPVCGEIYTPEPSLPDEL